MEKKNIRNETTQISRHSVIEIKLQMMKQIVKPNTNDQNMVGINSNENGK